MYYPPSTKFTTIDGMELLVIKYGPIKRYKDMSRVVVYCKPVDDTYNLIETIPNKPILDKIIKEMNNILISNDELKKLLPQYSYNWMLYNETKVDDRSEAASHRILDNIGFLEYQAQFAQQENIASILEQGYDLIPKKSINDIYNFSIDFTRKRYPIFYHNIVKNFRMKAIANWLIYIAENIDKNIDYEDIKLLNKYRDYAKIDISVASNPVVGNDMQFYLYLPADSDYDYKINLYQVAGHLEYVSYDIDAIRLFQINKKTKESIELVNASMQPDNFDAFVKILEILSGYIDDQILMTDYYRNISVIIDKMDVTKPTIVEDDTTTSNDESEEQKLERFISNTVDEKVLPRVSEILNKYILEGSLQLNSDGTTQNFDGDSDNVIIYESV